MRYSFLVTVIAALVGCGGQQTDVVTEQAPPPAAVADFRLPVSINDVMVALVNEAADPLWIAAWKQPATDAEWRELERRAYQLQLAGALIEYPGTGGLDHKWTAKPTWKQWSNELRDAGGTAIEAVQSKDVAQIGQVGDRVVEICEGCHRDFKLAFPTAGKFGEISPNAADLDN